MSQYEELIKQFKAVAPTLQLPPPSMEELGIEYVSIIPGKEIIAKLPFKQKFTNPTGIYQGGFLSAALDEVFGPLSFISSQGPCLTLSLNVTFLKAFVPSMKECRVQATILKETRQFIFMKGEVTTLEGELIAFAESHVTKVSK